MNEELIGLIIGVALTICIFSYVLWPNSPFYRLGVHILVGVSAAYAAVIVIRQVILPIYEQIRLEPQSVVSFGWLIVIFLALLLFLKRLPAIAWLGNGTVAFLVGVGAATALIGALRGTILPQITAVSSEGAIHGLIIALLTICTLLTFQFTQSRRHSDREWERPVWQQGPAIIGRIVLSVTFGALFAGVFNTSLILLIERVSYFINGFSQIVP